MRLRRVPGIETFMNEEIVRRTVRELDGYTPGEQPAAGERVIKLNTNENPYPPSPAVLDAIAAIGPDALRRYPQPAADDFREVAARALGVSPEMIVAGNGSDDVLTIATRAALNPGDILAYPDPTYSLYSVIARLQDARPVGVPWGEGWSLPTEALLATGARAIYLANPNAPSGTSVSPRKVSALAAAFPGLLLIDEAYADFADENCLDLVMRHPNVVVSRTLSKAYSLAGIRFGFAVAQPAVARELLKVKDSYNCDAVSICAAVAALKDPDYARAVWQKIRSERARLTEALERQGWDVIPSHANFVFARPPHGRAEQTYRALKSVNILVRYFDRPGLSDKVRITVGTPSENDALLSALGRISERSAGA